MHTCIVLTLFIFVLLVAFAGTRISRWLWQRFAEHAERNILEKVASAALISIAIWIAIVWALAIPMWMTTPSLLAAAVVVSGVALATRQRLTIAIARLPAVAYVVLVPLVSWTAFLLWRGWVAPPVGPDTLTYHMPRALLFTRAQGYAQFGLPELRVDLLAANYELLLASILQLSGADTITEWLSVFFALFFLVQTAAMAHRWWRSNAGTAATVLLVAAAPVFLLHGAAHKNDVMASAFFVAALHWLVRWRGTYEPPAAILGIIAVVAGIGTKAHGFAMAAALLPFVVRRISLRHAVAFSACGVVALALLGGYHYAHPAVPPPPAARIVPAAEHVSLAARAVPAQWGEFTNLVEVPALVLLAPFAPNSAEVPVPWRGEAWLWGRYDVYASTFGWAFSFVALAAPFALWKTRDWAGNRDRLLAAGATLLFLLLILPARFQPRGYVSGFPRYTFLVLAVIASLVMPPLLEVIRRHGQPDGDRIALITVVLLAGYFVVNAYDAIRFDKWAPLGDLEWAAAHPGVRRLPSETVRSEFVVDELAAQDDVIDVHGGFDSWIYPAFGRDLKRDVRYINDAADIRPAARWVIVDRAYNAIWKAPGFDNMADWRQYLGRGVPTAEDMKVMNELKGDPRFEVIFVQPGRAQAVFRRR